MIGPQLGVQQLPADPLVVGQLVQLLGHPQIFGVLVTGRYDKRLPPLLQTIMNLQEPLFVTTNQLIIMDREPSSTNISQSFLMTINFSRPWLAIDHGEPPNHQSLADRRPRVSLSRLL